MDAHLGNAGSGPNLNALFLFAMWTGNSHHNMGPPLLRREKNIYWRTGKTFFPNDSVEDSVPPFCPFLGLSCPSLLSKKAEHFFQDLSVRSMRYGLCRWFRYLGESRLKVRPPMVERSVQQRLGQPVLL